MRPMIGNNKKLCEWLGANSSGRMPELGERELDVLEVLWAGGQRSAQDVRDALPRGAVSLSTVQSTLERLHRKELLGRVKAGRAYQYEARVTRSQLIGGLLRDLAADVAGGDVAPMLSGFLDYVFTEAPELGPKVSRALSLETKGKGSND